MALTNELLLPLSVQRDLLPFADAQYNVKRFGAKGDGVRNDWRNIQAAITSAAQRQGGVIYFPPGTYYCGTSRLSYISSHRVMFRGAGWSSRLVFDLPAGAPAVGKGMLNAAGIDGTTGICERIEIRDLSFDFGGSFASGSNANQGGVNLWNCLDLLVEKCRFQGAVAGAVILGSSASVSIFRGAITRNLFISFPDQAVSAIGPAAPRAVSVFDNHISSSTDAVLFSQPVSEELLVYDNWRKDSAVGVTRNYGAVYLSLSDVVN